MACLWTGTGPSGCSSPANRSAGRRPGPVDLRQCPVELPRNGSGRSSYFIAPVIERQRVFRPPQIPGRRSICPPPQGQPPGHRDVPLGASLLTDELAVEGDWAEYYDEQYEYCRAAPRRAAISPRFSWLAAYVLFSFLSFDSPMIIVRPQCLAGASESRAGVLRLSSGPRYDQGPELLHRRRLSYWFSQYSP